MAVTTTSCAKNPKAGPLDGMVQGGAVYNPAEEMLPKAGVIDQFTPVLAVPVTIAVNWTVWEALMIAGVGVTLIEMDGASSITAEETEAAPMLAVI